MSLSVVQRVLLGFIVLLVLLFVVAGSGITGLNSVQQRIVTVTGDVADISDGSNALGATMSQTSGSVLQYLIASSDASLEEASMQYSEAQDAFRAQLDHLKARLSSYPDILAVLNAIESEAGMFVGVADTAIAEHSRQVQLERALPDKKLDLKDQLSFAIEDLEAIERFPESNEQEFAAGLAKTQMQSLKLLVGDYFDSSDLESLPDIAGEIERAFAPVDKVLSKLNDENLVENISAVRSATTGEDGVILDYYELNKIRSQSELAASSLVSSLTTVQEH